MKALLIGGTGPTGPHIAAGLARRGYEVTILHRGVHEDPALDGYRHIHVVEDTELVGAPDNLIVGPRHAGHLQF